MKTILVTGGAGYIGSHTCVELLAAGYGVVVVDNLANGSAEALRRVEKLTHRDLMFVEADVLDESAMDQVLREFPVDAVIHLAGLTPGSGPEISGEDYFKVNLGGAIALCDVLEKHKTRNIVFGSSAAVYGTDSREPLPEYVDKQPAGSFGRTKLAAEQHLQERHQSDGRWNCIALRGFNAAGAHPGGLLSSWPGDAPCGLIPIATEVAAGYRDELPIYGNEFDTQDGTSMRDYVHVVDMARAHVLALNLLKDNRGFMALNVGSGKAVSAMQIVSAVKRITGRKVPLSIEPARKGELAVYMADTAKADMELGPVITLGLEDIIRNAWTWQCTSPGGYSG